MMDRKLFEELREAWKRLKWLRIQKKRMKSQEFLDRFGAETDQLIELVTRCLQQFQTRDLIFYHNEEYMALAKRLKDIMNQEMHLELVEQRKVFRQLRQQELAQKRRVHHPEKNFFENTTQEVQDYETQQLSWEKNQGRNYHREVTNLYSNLKYDPDAYETIKNQRWERTHAKLLDLNQDYRINFSLYKSKKGHYSVNSIN